MYYYWNLMNERQQPLNKKTKFHNITGIFSLAEYQCRRANL